MCNCQVVICICSLLLTDPFWWQTKCVSLTNSIKKCKQIKVVWNIKMKIIIIIIVSRVLYPRPNQVDGIFHQIQFVEGVASWTVDRSRAIHQTIFVAPFGKLLNSTIYAHTSITRTQQYQYDIHIYRVMTLLLTFIAQHLINALKAFHIEDHRIDIVLGPRQLNGYSRSCWVY